MPAPQEGICHAAALLCYIEALLVDAPLKQRAPVQHHQVLHQAVRFVGRVDAPLLLAQVHQLPQQPVIHPLIVFLQHRLLRVAQAVDKRLVEHLVRRADLQGPAHKVQQLFPAGRLPVRQILLLQGRIRLVHHVGHLDGQLILTFKVMVNIAHGAAHRLSDLLHGYIFKTLPVEQGQCRTLYLRAHFYGLPFPGRQFLFHGQDFYLTERFFSSYPTAAGMSRHTARPRGKVLPEDW